MKKKNAFTLAELLGVVVIISLLMIISIPPIINQIKANMTKVSEATKVIVEQATLEYIKARENAYPITDGTIYCITLQQLVDGEYIDDPFIDVTTNLEIPLNRMVKVNIVKSYDVTYTFPVETCP